MGLHTLVQHRLVVEHTLELHKLVQHKLVVERS
jgi:hypothetical protein